MNGLLAFGILAIVFGLLIVVANRAIWWGMNSGRSPKYCVTFSTLVLLGVYGFTIIIARLVFQQDIVGLWQQEFEASLQATIAMYVELGLEAAEVERSARLIRLLFLQGIAGWIVAMTIALSMVSYLIQRKMVKPLPASAQPIPAFSLWRVSEKLVWLLLAAMLFVLLGTRGNAWAAWLGVNGTIVLASFYFTVGLSIVMFYLEKRNVGRLVKILLVFLLLLFPVLIVLVTLVGTLDTWWDLRKLRTPSQKE
jgi:uncharacterized protein YybS (DUF2232 family)